MSKAFEKMWLLELVLKQYFLILMSHCNIFLILILIPISIYNLYNIYISNIYINIYIYIYIKYKLKYIFYIKIYTKYLYKRFIYIIILICIILILVFYSSNIVFKGSHIKNLRKRGRKIVSSTDSLLVKCTYNNCTEENIYLHFRLCTRCSSYFCSHRCNLDQQIIKLLNEGTDNYLFCPACTKPELNAVFLDKDVDELCKIFLDSMKARTDNLESKQFQLKIPLNSWRRSWTKQFNSYPLHGNTG